MDIVSLCLIGTKCDYKGEDRLNQRVFEEFQKGYLLPVCPEILGGMSIPRYSAEIVGGTGIDVLDSRAKVVDSNGIDVTCPFIKGAFATVKIARTIGAKKAIFKSESPSCGCGRIPDGTFSGKLIKGDGVTAALLKKSGIKVYTEENFR